jgi:hypothetical protein
VVLEGSRLVLGPAAVDNSRKYAVRYLEWLDSGLSAFDRLDVP